MLIETDRILPPGTTLTCSFFLPDSTRIQAAAEVVRTLGRVSREAANRYGVRFLQLGIREREALERFIDQKAAKAFP